MINTVLIATDGSSHADKAVAFGCDIASKYGAKVVVVHVLLRDHLSESLRHMAAQEYGATGQEMPFTAVIAASPYGRFPLANIIPEDVSGPHDALHAVANHIISNATRIAREHGVKDVDSRIEDGNPASRIVEAAEETGADLIVTGARGLSDLKALMVGSVSHRIAHTAPMTCIAVR
ncbi:universal stress protein [Hoeflea prorocentri]|uniref:Universal stress protein n=1 Tax=Hoeflea prorocentri TaxID=1922333 RepID=A0A9X3UHV1_9HYPH|nr:universal stress protein [Hoeflea prorocentri]MCY6379459.1 universal stress protein [Hoeflea prorocentri]MDA5397259.1 universal stress protein [Hoeflea prorocentri]